MLKKLASFIGKYKIFAILTPICMVGEVAMEVLIPFVTASIIDKGISGRDIGYVAKMGALMVGMAFLSLCFGALGGRFAALASTGFAKNIRRGLFNKVQDFSFANTDHFSTSSLVTRLTTDVTNTQNAFQMILRMAVRSPMMLVFSLIAALASDRSLSVIFLIALPILTVVIIFVLAKTFPRFKDMLKKYDKMNAMVQECLVAIRVVKAFVRGEYEEEKFRDSADQVRAAQIKAERLITYGMPFMSLSMSICLIAVLWLGGNKVLEGAMLVGELNKFLTYISMILISLVMLAAIFVMLVLSRASAVRIVEVLDEKLDIEDKESDLTPKDGSIVFNNVSFSYAKSDDNLTLTDIKLSIKSGETVGIIGGTGSAKTSLVQLIPRLYDVQSGSVIVGGHDVREYSLDTLRNSVAMVLQKNVLFSGTIKENLRWGDKDANDEEIIEACRSAQAHDFIMSFPDGYDTDLGQGGVNVSGGQKQRLCIARALLKKPKIIILDDSTSAVDTATDTAIRTALSTELADTTTIIIAQRITSVCDADKIVVLDEGRISAVGTHEQLMESSEIYREVFNSQQKGVA